MSSPSAYVWPGFVDHRAGRPTGKFEFWYFLVWLVTTRPADRPESSVSGVFAVAGVVVDVVGFCCSLLVLFSSLLRILFLLLVLFSRCCGVQCYALLCIALRWFALHATAPGAIGDPQRGNTSRRPKTAPTGPQDGSKRVPRGPQNECSGSLVQKVFD